MDNLFGTKLKELRKNSGNSAKAIADYLEFSVSYISEVEKGTRKPFRLDIILKLAGYYGIDSTELVKAALFSSKELKLKFNKKSKSEIDLAFYLQKNWTNLTDLDFEDLLKFLEKN